jgi:pSer/pThr/pTyr-binding forkhead associated (FHA) protein
MWKLTIEDDESSQTSLHLAADEYHIGRDEGNNVRLTDRNISRRHATLKREGDESWALVDHESCNGSFVNGQRVAGAAKVGHADLVQLGDYRIFLTNEDRALAPPSASGRPAVSSVPPTPEYPDRLVVVVGPEPGYECRLDRGVVTIGRSEECTFAINHPSVSRVHAVVHPVAPGRFEILDKDSANGLRINGVDMRRKILEGGDVIEFGDVQVRYCEQGQGPRLGGDVSQRLPAGGDPVSARGDADRPSRRGGVGRWVALSLGLLAVGVGALVVQARSKSDGAPGQALAPDAATPAAAAPGDDASGALVERAREAVRTEPAEALRLLASLPEGSSRRRSAEASEVAAQAADALLREASKEVDSARRQPLLKPLLGNALVDAERRRQAGDLLRAVEAVPPPPAVTDAALPRASAVASVKERPPARERSGAAGAEGGEREDGPRVAAARAREVRERDVAPAARPPPTAARTADKPREEQPVDVSQAVEDEPTMRRRLEPRVYGGRATIDEVRMLKAICGHQGDALCKEKAQEALRKFSE